MLSAAKQINPVRSLLFTACVSGVVASCTLYGCRDSTSAETLPVVASDRASAAGSVPALAPEARRIRVLIQDHVQMCRLNVHEPFEVRRCTDDHILKGLTDPMSLEIRIEGGTISIPALNMAVDDPIEIRPQGGVPSDLELVGESSRSYPGLIRFLPATGAEEGGAIVNEVDVEEYLVGVVTAELHQGFHRTACRAQAIASRTYAWYRISERHGRGDWDLCATEGSQVYHGLGRAELVPEATRAVHDTDGLVLTWDSPDGRRIFCTYYSSTCGGRTQPAGPVMRQLDIPPLGGVVCDYCRDAPRYEWGPLTLSKAEVTSALRHRYEVFQEMGAITEIEVAQQDEGGRIVRVRLLDDRGRSQPLEAENFRLAVDPRGRRFQSTWFSLETREEDFCFLNGRGFGHGVGLCQYGAQGMSEQGMSTLEILRHYYPDSSVSRAY